MIHTVCIYIFINVVCHFMANFHAKCEVSRHANSGSVEYFSCKLVNELATTQWYFFLNLVKYSQDYFYLVQPGFIHPYSLFLVLLSRTPLHPISPQRQTYHPEKSQITNSIFLAIWKIEDIPFFLANVWVSWGTSGAAWALGRCNETIQKALASIV